MQLDNIAYNHFSTAYVIYCTYFDTLCYCYDSTVFTIIGVAYTGHFTNIFSCHCPPEMFLDVIYSARVMQQICRCH